jgi:hypothetical protein
MNTRCCTCRWDKALRLLTVLLLLVAVGTPAYAHVGSKDVFEQVESGPYKLFVTVRTPVVIPGVANVEIRSSGAAIKSLEIAPVPMVGEASKHPPTPDAMHASTDDPAFFTGSIWLMASGSWQVRILGDGAAGRFTTGVPVPAIPLSMLPMQRSLGMVLAVLGIVLVLGMVGIVAAAVREARLPPGAEAPSSRGRRALVASAATLVLLVAGVWLGNKWWNVEAASYAADIYHPSDLRAQLHGDTLDLTIGSFNTEKKKWTSDSPSELLLDHQKVMHLYAIRWPEMDAAFHLHPAQVAGTDGLRENLPAMPPGSYRLYADIVHRNGFPETLTATLNIPAGLNAAALATDDARATPPPVGPTPLGASYKLPDGYAMVWDKPADLTANTGYSFRFHLLDPAGRPAIDVVPYLGMAGHAAWVKVDGSTFAHTHPEGSAAMPAVMLAEEANGSPSSISGPSVDMADMQGMSGTTRPLPPTVEFPYGFPAPGAYRVFIQMKHGSTVETGVFDALVK